MFEQCVKTIDPKEWKKKYKYKKSNRKKMLLARIELSNFQNFVVLDAIERWIKIEECIGSNS